MFFFCKPKTVVLDAFVTDKNLAELLPPAPAIKHRPKWWGKIAPEQPIKTSSGLVFDESTIRRCRGFKDYYSEQTLIVPLWTSFVMEFDQHTYKYVFPNEHNELAYHTESSRGSEYLKGYHHLKLMSPWKFREKSGIDFLFSQPFYNFTDPTKLIIPPGTVNYKYQNSTHLNFFVKHPENGETDRVAYDAGQPIIHLSPMTERKLDLRIHIVTKPEFDQLGVPKFFFTSAYKRAKNLGYGANIK